MHFMEQSQEVAGAVAAVVFFGMMAMASFWGSLRQTKVMRTCARKMMKIVWPDLSRYTS
jgi:hypothetical protein